MSANLDSFSLAELEQYRHVPALAPPPGVIPDFAAHNPRADVYNFLCAILLGFVYVFVCLRLYAKLWIKRSPGFDDLACVLGTIGLSACYGLAAVMSLHGVGKHQWDVPLSEIPFILRFGRYTSIVLPPTMLCVKLSLLLLYIRIFGPDKATKYLIYFGMGFCILAYTILMFFNIFSGITTVIGTNKTLGVVNFSSDIYILCVPAAAVSKLQLSVKKKVGVIFIFMTGIIACVMSIVGTVFRFQVRRAEVDATYLLAGTFLVTTIEEEVGLMCACMPFFPAIVQNSPALQKCIHSIQSLGSFRSSRQSSAIDGRRNHQKHASQDGSTDGDLELQGRMAFTEAVFPESPKKTPRMELGAFEGNEGPKSS